MIGNKFASRITGISKFSQRNNLEAVTNELDKEIPKEIYTSPKERQLQTKLRVSRKLCINIFSKYDLNRHLI